jgi:hypothetical protein
VAHLLAPEEIYVRSLLQMFSKPRAELALQAGSAAEAEPKTGLVIVEFSLATETAQTAKVRATVEGWSGKPYEKTLTLAPGKSQHWIAVHSHLLPNGPAKLRLEAEAGGVVAASKTLTLKIGNSGALAAQVADSLKAGGVPLIVDVCDSATYDYADPGLAAWFDRAPEAAEAHIAGLEASGRASAEEAQALRQFVRDGYLTLENAVPADLLGRLVAALDDAVANHIEGYEWGASQRIHNLHNHYPAIRELWLHPKVLHMLSLIFDEPAKPCQSLSYVFGSEQQYHQDTIHLTSFPAGRMCGVWTAVEDVQPDSGELVVFPGSHRERRVYTHDAGLPKVVDEDWTEFGEKVVPIWTEMLERGQYRREVYRPKAGTILIWHENLMHAGSPRRDRDKSRRSIVGHYFAHGAIVYYDSSGMPGIVQEAAPPVAAE